MGSLVKRRGGRVPTAPGSRCTRREALTALLVSAALLRARESAGTDRRVVFAFVPALMRARALESILEQCIPGASVTVFGRYADFDAAMTQAAPDAAIGPGDTLRSAGLRPVLTGMSGGSTYETLLVLSKRKLSRNDFAGCRFGAVDIVGRTRLPKLVGELLGLRHPPRVQRVVKVTDLLPLLQLDLADAILLPARFLADFLHMTELDFKVLQVESARLERICVAFPRRGGDAAIEASLNSLSLAAQGALGVEGWR